MGEVFGRGIDTAGNLHWHDTDDDHRVYIVQNNGICNFQLLEKCRQCGYYYNFMCCAEQCIKDGIVAMKPDGTIP